MKRRIYYVYIMANKWNTTIYVGVTNSLERRVREHKKGEGGYFTSKYNLTRLVYYEEFRSILVAIAREKQLKGLSRQKKENLINTINDGWRDLTEDWGDSSLRSE